MPVIFRFGGLRVVIYPNDHCPAHVHVKGAEGEAVFILQCPEGLPDLQRASALADLTSAGSKIYLLMRLSPCALNGGRSIAVTDPEFNEAEQRMRALREAGHAISARYGRRASRIVVVLSTGVQVAFPVRLAEGLAGAAPDDLTEIEISPAGLGLHWPRLDADIYVPALLQGVFGSKRWMAAHLGATAARSGLLPRPQPHARRAQGRQAPKISDWMSCPELGCPVSMLSSPLWQAGGNKCWM